MPLNIDLNTPYIDHEMMECNIAPSINLNDPSSSNFNLSFKDLHGSSSNEEYMEEANMFNCENDFEHGIFNINEDIDVDALYSNEVHVMEEESEFIPNEEDGEETEFNQYESDGETESIAAMSTMVQHEPETFREKRSFINNDQRKIIAQLLIKNSCGGKLKSGTVIWLASKYSVSIDVIYRIWKQVSQTGDASHKRTKNCGRKRVAVDIEKVRDISLAKRSTLQSLAFALGISKTALFKFVKDGTLRRHSNALKPQMKDSNMKDRLRFCLSMLEETSLPHDPEFKSMHNIVHIDEKWFYMTKKSANYYLLENENEPYRTCKNKNFIGKVMFLVAVARPRFDDGDKEIFSGKIGVFPLVQKVAAKRSSINRASGTLETKPITSITKEVSRNFLINKVLPAIKEKWPREHAMETIYIQQDNAPCHVSIDDEEFRKAASEGGFDIRLSCQPPNSPDLNVLDLGFFNVIQSLQQKEVSKSVDELIEVVQNSYDNFSSKQSDKNFLTLQSCMIEIMKIKGSNNYRIPHMKKEVLLNRGILPTQLKCDRELVENTFQYLNNDN
ncbi:hypothetical protein KIW84_024998 [Lathyrus oleraceus]|uniref:DUF7769 domain-containing protein n=1 Tax=Pisum sativum TaxID=3888 RepID=A0A9D5BA22_PEA|nr:hypothetical protein KIW84_024998 [Pisum sativum]